MEQPTSSKECVMRLVPVSLFYAFRDLKTCVDAAVATTGATHSHSTARDATRLFSTIMWHILHGYTKSDLFSRNLFETLPPHYLSEQPELRALMTDLNKVQLHLDDARYSSEAHGAMNYAIHALRESYEEGLRMVVMMGNDNDTTAAIYGALAGALYGRPTIPQWMQDQLYAGPVIEQTARALLDLAVNPLEDVGKKYPRIINKEDELANVNPMHLAKELWYFKTPINPQVDAAKVCQSKSMYTGFPNAVRKEKPKSEDK